MKFRNQFLKFGPLCSPVKELGPDGGTPGLARGPPQEPRQIMTGPEVDARLKINPSTRWRWHRDSDIAFPAAFRLGRRRCGYWADEIENWLRGRPNATPSAK